MKVIFLVLAALAMAGCASDWKAYSDANHCQSTDKVKRVASVNSFSSTSMAGPNSLPTMAGPSMDLRYESYRLYRCDNGSIWGPLSAAK